MLLCLLILLSTAGLSAAGYIGKDTVYRSYAADFPREPWLVPVMKGIHDGVWPWRVLPAYADGGSPLESLLALLPAGEGKKQDEAAETAAADPAEDASAEAETAAATAAEEAETASEAPSREETVEATTVITTQGRVKTAQAVQPGVIPDGVCSEVVPAKDYGSAAPAFLSPDDTQYNRDTEGMFAQNGTYYLLQKVDRSYLKDALFIGDSRVQGLWEYGGITDVASFLCKESITTFTILDETLQFGRPGENPQWMKLEDALKSTSFRKIYISLGINEVGYPDTESYYHNYRSLLEKIRGLQPDAIIYIEGMMHVTEELSRHDIAINNRIVVQRNKAVSTLANGHDIFYIDMNEHFCDDDGNLLAEMTGDGVHLYGSYYSRWTDAVLENAVIRSEEDYQE